MLYRNLPLKAASLLLAVFLWFWVLFTEQNPIVEQTLSNVPVKAEGIRAGLTLQDGLRPVEVRVRGLKHDMPEVRGSLQATVLCRNLAAGGYRLGVQASGPKDVKVVWVRPAEVSVTLEEIVSESRTVEAKIVSEPPAGYELLGAQVSPKVVRVSGPRTRVDRVSRVLVTLDLERVVPGVAISLPARAVDSSGASVQDIALTPPQVNALADLKPIVVSKALPVFVRTKGNPPGELEVVSLQVTPPVVTAVLPASLVTEVTHIDTQEVDLSQARASFTRKVGLVAPGGVSLLSDSTVTVTARLARAPRPPAHDPRPDDMPVG